MTLWAFPPVDSNSSTLAVKANILVVVNILSYIFLSLKVGFENNVLKTVRKDTISYQMPDLVVAIQRNRCMR
jgi:hypothetical protein